MTVKVKVEIDEQTRVRIDSWLGGLYDEETKGEIRRLAREAPEQLRDAFYTQLSFGTGGLRGLMGVGTNRMNRYTVRAATHGLATTIRALHPEGGSLLIGYDCRLQSRLFAEETAKVLAAHGFTVFLYKELRPVALVSFGLLHKGCLAGVMITASHNPPEYNGYKVYWSHGGQVLPPYDRRIMEAMDGVTDLTQIKVATYPHPLIHEVGSEIDEAYLRAIAPLALFPEQNRKEGGSLHIVYTSLHGGGITMVPRALAHWGFSHVEIVEEQATPDGRFPTVKSPNPEEHESLKLGIRLLEWKSGDLLLATDPDVDRLAVVVRHEGRSVSLNGNMSACLALEHILSSLTHLKKMPAHPTVVKSIVTSELFRAIGERYKVSCLDVLTGFKYIGEKIGQWEEERKSSSAAPHFIFGGEESYGALFGTHARDKDGVIFGLVLCELALQQKRAGKTLVDALHALYCKYGVYREQLLSLTFEGKAGLDHIAHLMEELRREPPARFNGVAVERVCDYQSGQARDLRRGAEERLELPRSDVLSYELADGTKLVIRPSGTEPKIKIYGATFEEPPTLQGLEEAIERCDRRAAAYLDFFKGRFSLPKRS